LNNLSQSLTDLRAQLAEETSRRITAEEEVINLRRRLQALTAGPFNSNGPVGPLNYNSPSSFGPGYFYSDAFRPPMHRQEYTDVERHGFVDRPEYRHSNIGGHQDPYHYREQLYPPAHLIENTSPPYPQDPVIHRNAEDGVREMEVDVAVTNAPVTNAPVTNAPVTNAPVTNAPVAAPIAPVAAPIAPVAAPIADETNIVEDHSVSLVPQNVEQHDDKMLIDETNSDPPKQTTPPADVPASPKQTTPPADVPASPKQTTPPADVPASPLNQMTTPTRASQASPSSKETRDTVSDEQPDTNMCAMSNEQQGISASANDNAMSENNHFEQQSGLQADPTAQSTFSYSSDTYGLESNAASENGENGAVQERSQVGDQINEIDNAYAYAPDRKGELGDPVHPPPPMSFQALNRLEPSGQSSPMRSPGTIQYLDDLKKSCPTQAEIDALFKGNELTLTDSES
jgi:hypothetical protein